MENLISEELRCKIENDLYRLIEANIEGEYDMDRFDNLVYKEGGKERAEQGIRTVIQEYAQENNLDRDIIIEILKNAFSSMSPAVKEEQKELMEILSSLESPIIDREEKEKEKAHDFVKPEFYEDER